MSTPAPASTGQPTWADVLDRLERGVTHAESVLDAGLAVEDVDDWEPPRDLAPLPTRLRVRAEALLERQRRVEQRMRTALEGAARRRADVDSVGTAYAGTRTPLYVDVAV